MTGTAGGKGEKTQWTELKYNIIATHEVFPQTSCASDN